MLSSLRFHHLTNVHAQTAALLLFVVKGSFHWPIHVRVRTPALPPPQHLFYSLHSFVLKSFLL